MVNEGSAPLKPSRVERRRARRRKAWAKQDRDLEIVFNAEPPTFAAVYRYNKARWIVVSLLFAPVGAGITWVFARALGPVIMSGVAGALVATFIQFIKRWNFQNPKPSRQEHREMRERYCAKREHFLPTALVNQFNPRGKRPEDYPAEYQDLFRDLSEIAAQASAVIKVTSYSDATVSVDSGPYLANTVRQELIDRAALDNKQLTLVSPVILHPEGWVDPATT